ncbi:hypothetical protein HOY34_13080 [Xinfangfangia sp. D13-10-4-6]|uniref:hypothetical protein n=1 Tax=Pseudogemmobacter hezensis TaxID=2737662 RepID=UPI001555EEF9|nr:hypothetical protein [Pseudogemmobacter hezensis]NPD16132.1 hypothetical protein [Pseudogemmobacter hezensis]
MSSGDDGNNGKTSWKPNIEVCMEWLSDKLPGFTKSLFEVIVTVGFTFIPFFFLSIKWLKSDGANTASSLSGSFLGFWQSGEVVLPILGMCGAVVALLALNVGYFSWWVHAIVGLVVLIFTIGSGAVLIATGGMKQSLNSELITVGFVSYVSLALIWLFLAAVVRTTEARPRGSDRYARKLLDQVNKQRDIKESQS